MAAIKWSKEELEYLRTHYHLQDNRSLANEMGRSEVALRTKAYRLEIKRGDWRSNRPDLTPSPSLSYIIGVIFGDGSPNMVRRKTGRTNYNIDLFVTDKDFADAFNEALYQVLGRRYAVTPYGNRYQVRGQSKVLYLLLKDRDLDSLRKFIDPFPTDFIRGFSYSEGSACLYRIKGYKYVKIDLPNTNSEVVVFIKSLLQLLNIRAHFHERPIGKKSVKRDGSVIIPKKPMFNLNICDKTSIKIFSEKIGFSIGRKQNRLMEAVA